MGKYQNKYRNESARAQWWDYGWNGAYFITICTQNREHYFSEIKNAKMVLSPTGVIADILWHEIPNHFNYVELGEFVVMPNHVHGLLILDKPDNGNTNVVVAGVGTGHALSLPLPQPQQQTPQQSIDPQAIGRDRFQNIGKNTVSSIIGSYKSAVTKHANRLGLENGWQARFHDHIIRNNAEYQRIADYIGNNPNNWTEDQFYLS
jgi:putative transposase